MFVVVVWNLGENITSFVVVLNLGENITFDLNEFLFKLLCFVMFIIWTDTHTEIILVGYIY